VYHPLVVNVVVRQNCSPVEEQQRLEAALAQAAGQIQLLYQRALANIGAQEAAIFEAHKMFLEDPEFLDAIHSQLTRQRTNAEAAVECVVEEYAAQMLALQDEYFRARAQDIRDVGRRLQRCLAGGGDLQAAQPLQPSLILADDLAPSDTVQFPRHLILGLCTVRGGPTSHTAILARSLGVPAAVSVPIDLDQISSQALAVLDGSQGVLLIEPNPDELAQARSDQAAWQVGWQAQMADAHLPAVTRDGRRVEVVANIGSLDDARQAVACGAEGVGLLRTEFLYLDRSSMPDEAEQVATYRAIFEVMQPYPVVVRTLDIGGDKRVDYLGLKEEPNPFLGWRAIRMISERPDILLSQLRALLQAGVNSDLRIMLPMVSCAEEVQHARRLLDQARRSLLEDGLPCAGAVSGPPVQFGIMVEVPSAALLAEQLAELVDFFSIGTNDLTQYTLAVDRTNERVASLASPFHPAVLRLIAMTIEGAHAKGKWVGLCGEMGGDALAAPLLLGLGLDEFSMAPAAVPALKQVLRSLNISDCQELARRLLRLSTAEDVIQTLRQTAAH
jgi:phosphoenolpyruvate-protein phosphotransferase